MVLNTEKVAALVWIVMGIIFGILCWLIVIAGGLILQKPITLQYLVYATLISVAVGCTSGYTIAFILEDLIGAELEH